MLERGEQVSVLAEVDAAAALPQLAASQGGVGQGRREADDDVVVARHVHAAGGDHALVLRRQCGEQEAGTTTSRVETLGARRFCP